MQVKMLVPSNVVQLEALGAEGLELGADLHSHLPADVGQEKHRGAGEPPYSIETAHVRRPDPGRPSATAPARRRPASDAADRKPRQPARQFNGGCRRRRADHQACRCRDSFNMRPLDGLVDLVGETEVVGRDDQILGAPSRAAHVGNGRTPRPRAGVVSSLPGFDHLSNESGNLARAEK